MNERIRELAQQCFSYSTIVKPGEPQLVTHAELEKFAELIVEETLKQVDERTYCRGETSWYNDDKDWVRLHFGYGKFVK